MLKKIEYAIFVLVQQGGPWRPRIDCGAYLMSSIEKLRLLNLTFRGYLWNVELVFQNDWECRSWRHSQQLGPSLEANIYHLILRSLIAFSWRLRLSY